MPDLAGCHGAGANPAEAIADAASAMREWAEARIAKHLPIPNPPSAIRRNRQCPWRLRRDRSA
ncbi:hypothetical protein [Mesorhizobium sp. M0205]